MTDQLALAFDDRMAGVARRSDPISSQVAARTCNAEGQRARIAALLQREQRAMYVAEIAARLELPAGEVNARMRPMERRGEVTCVGMGVNHHGRPVQLWAARRTSRPVVTVRTDLL